MQPQRLFVHLLFAVVLLLQGALLPLQPVFAQELPAPTGDAPAAAAPAVSQNPLPTDDGGAPAAPAAISLPLAAPPVVAPSVTPAAFETELKAGESTDFQISVSTGSTPIGKADVMLVFDLTGSMGGEISQVRTSALEIANTIRAQLPNSWFGVASFMDYAATYSYPGYSAQYGSSSYGDVPWKLNLHPTDSLGDMTTEINKLKLGWGADTPEDYTRVLHELGKVEQIGWRQGAKKIVVLFGDAPTHDLDFAGYNYGGDPGPDSIAQTADDLDFETVVQQLAAKQITVIAIDSGFSADSEATFRGMSVGHARAPGTQGQYYQLTNTEDIPQLIVDSVLAEAKNIDLLSLVVTDGYESWVTLDPPSIANVPAMTTTTFAVTVKPPAGTAPGYYPFTIRTVADGDPLAITLVYITIPASDPKTNLGFDPDVHGFGVSNVGTTQTWEMYKQFFGARQVEYTDKTPIHAAQAFFDESYRTAGDGGSCDAFSSLSLLNFKRLAQPNAGAFSLPITDNLYKSTDSDAEVDKVRNAIGYAQGIQAGAEIWGHRVYTCSRLQNSPRQYFNYIKSLISNGAPAVISLWWLDDPKKGPVKDNHHGHSVVALRYEELPDNIADVYVYDNNWRGDDSFRLRFDLAKDTVRYEDTNTGLPDILKVSWDKIKAAPCPQLAVTPLDYYLHQGVTYWEVPGGTAAAADGAADYQAYAIQGFALLLFENDSGERFGWNGAEFLQEIPGATFSRNLNGDGDDGGAFYTLPSDSTYNVWLVGTGEGQADVSTWMGSTFVEIADVAVTTGSVLALDFAGSGSTVGVSGANAPTTASISINHILADQDRTVTVADVPVQPGQSVQMTYTLAAGAGAADVGAAAAAADQISFASSGGAGGAYDLSLHRGGAGGYVVFGADDIALPANTTHALTIAEWAALSTLTIAADVGQDGIPDTPLVVENMAQPAAVEVSIPAEGVVGSQIDIRLGVRDQHGAYVANGTQVAVSTTAGSLSAATGTTVGGLVHLKLVAPNQVGAATVRATAGGAAGEATIVFAPDAVAAIHLAPAPATLPADGVSSSLVRARLVDQFNNPIAGAAVDFTTTLGAIDPVAVTAGDGWAQATFTATLQVGTARVTAQSGSLTQTVGIPLVGSQIRGLLFADFNANGSQEAAEPGLSGIEITLRNNLSGAVFTTRSAGDGRFGFTDLPLTDYTLTVATVPGLHWNGPTTFALRLGIAGAEAPALGGSYNLFLPATQRR